jgi:signal transduction histidine kinase/CheY-like chemotaxis protein
MEYSSSSSGRRLSPDASAQPFWPWLLLCVMLVAFFGYLRLVLFEDRLIPLTYALPLLVCIWSRDLRLLYGMAIAFSALAVVHLFAHEQYDVLASAMILVNVWTVAGVVHALLSALGKLEQKTRLLEASNEELEQNNEELAARDEEISRQNEELQAQSEELEQQNQELQQQSEELEQQSRELQATNDELARRERGLQTLLDSARWMRSDVAERDVMGAICQAAIQVMDEGACAAAVLQEQDGRLCIRGHCGFGAHGATRNDCPFDRSFASLVMERGQTAYLEDTRTRPDIDVIQPLVGPPVRSVLAAPIWVEGKVAGVVEAYSRQPRHWTEDEFRVVEWLAAQTALSMQAMAQQRELELRRREAEDASIQKTRFLAAVSHDVRTPANAISLMADLIERGASDPAQLREMPQLARDLKASARSLVELVSDVLDLARFDTGKTDVQASDFCLDALLEADVRQQQPIAEYKGLRLSVSLPAAPVWVRTDKIKLKRVISNLVGNAIKFTNRGGEVQLRCTIMLDGGLELAVADTGVGIPVEHLPKIFDEFHQLRNPERDRNKGTGLGLAICQRLAQALGCTISVDSIPGEGTTFYLRMPAEVLIPAPIVPPPKESLAIRGDDGDGRGLGTDGNGFAGRDGSLPLAGLRILMIEDHRATRTTAARLLAAEGASVVQAESARAGMRMLTHERPHVLLLDLMLPDLDGTEVLRQLQHHRPPSLTCVLAISGDVRDARTEEVLQLGADGLLPKPLNIETLVSILRRHCPGLKPSEIQASSPSGALEARSVEPA